jgi:Ca-activated chloride channel homolog
VFSSPGYLWLLVSVFLLILTYNLSFGWSRKKAIRFANFDAISQATKRTILPRRIIPLIVKCIILVFVVLSVSGMGIWYQGYSSEMDYVLAIDASGSMLADDYSPNRLEVAKESAKYFVDSLGPGVKIGVISFSGSSFIDQSLVDDKMGVKNSIDAIEVVNIGGTAIGDAIVLSSNIFKLSVDETRGRSVVLLTDGQSNVGIDIGSAINYAVDNGIVVNTIGVGTEEGGEFSEGLAVSKLDEETLGRISEETGGSFFLVSSEEQLKEAYLEILDLTKTKVYFDARIYLMIAAFILLLLEWTLDNTRYKTIV